MEKEFTRLSLYKLFKESSDRTIDQKLQFIENRLADITKCPEDERHSLKRSLSHFKADFKKKWSLANNKDERFLQKNSDWLANTIKVPIFSLTTPGRTEKDFNELCERSKRRKTEDLRQQLNSEELTFAASMSHRAYGNPDAADLIKIITEIPTKATEFKKVLLMSEKDKVKKHTPEEFGTGNFY